jgi:hypothetical protein
MQSVVSLSAVMLYQLRNSPLENLKDKEESNRFRQKLKFTHFCFLFVIDAPRKNKLECLCI